MRLRLETAPGCLESTSTTDVLRHEHPCEHHLWRPPAALPWGNPAGSRLRDPSRARCFHRRRVGRRTTLTVIQPPAVARLTARRPASGHAAIPVHDGEGACARTSSWLSRGIETAAALSAGGRFCRANPLTPLFTSGALAAGAAWFAIRRARFNQGTSMQPIFPSSEVPSAGEVRCPRPLRARSMERCPRWPARGAAARVHRSFRKLESFEGSD